MRWLIQDPDLRNLHVDSDAVEYVPGAPVRVDGAAARPRLPAAARAARSSSSSRRGADPATRRAGRRRRSVTVGEDGTAVHELGGLDARRLPRRGPAPTIAGRQVDASDIFLVREGGTELDRPVGDPATLEAIADGDRRRRARAGRRAAGATSTFDPPRIVRVDRRTDVELWSRPGLLLLVVGLARARVALAPAKRLPIEQRTQLHVAAARQPRHRSDVPGHRRRSISKTLIDGLGGEEALRDEAAARRRSCSIRAPRWSCRRRCRSAGAASGG